MDELTARLINARLGRPAPEQSLPEAALRGAGAALSLGYLSDPAASAQHPVAYWLGQLAGSSPYWALGAEALQSIPAIEALSAVHPAISRVLTAGALGGGFGSIEEAGRELGAREPLSPGRIAESGVMSAPLAAVGEAGLLGLRRLFYRPLPIPAEVAAQRASAGAASQGRHQATAPQGPPEPSSSPGSVPPFPGSGGAAVIDPITGAVMGHVPPQFTPGAATAAGRQPPPPPGGVPPFPGSPTGPSIDPLTGAIVGEVPPQFAGGASTTGVPPAPAFTFQTGKLGKAKPSVPPSPVKAQSASAEPAPEVRPAAAPTGGQAGAATQGGPQPGIKFIITAADRAALRALGYSAEDISRMRPEEAGTILAQGLRKGPTQAGAVPPKPGQAQAATPLPSALAWLKPQFTTQDEAGKFISAYEASVRVGNEPDTLEGILLRAPAAVKRQIQKKIDEVTADVDKAFDSFTTLLKRRKVDLPDGPKPWLADADAWIRAAYGAGKGWKRTFKNHLDRFRNIAQAPLAEDKLPAWRRSEAQHIADILDDLTSQARPAPVLPEAGEEALTQIRKSAGLSGASLFHRVQNSPEDLAALMEEVEQSTNPAWQKTIREAVIESGKIGRSAGDKEAQDRAAEVGVMLIRLAQKKWGAEIAEQMANEAVEAAEAEPVVQTANVSKQAALKAGMTEAELGQGESEPELFSFEDLRDPERLADVTSKQSGRIALPLVSALARGGIGAGVGGVAGAATGDTPEERRRRALFGAGIGGALGLGAPALMRGIPEFPGMIGRVLRSERGAVGGPPLVPPFYSHLRRVVDEKMPEKVSVEQLIGPPAGIRKKTPSGEEIKGGWLRAQGVKEDELEHTGLLRQLEGLRGKTITKKDLQDFLDQNAVQVQSKVYGQYSAPEYRIGSVERWQQVGENRWQDKWTNTLSIERTPEGYQLRIQDPYGTDEPFRVVPTFEEAAFLARDFQDFPRDQYYTPPKYQQLALPGGTNYREEALSLPNPPDPDRPFKGGHFVSNEVANMRFTDRDMTVGDKALFVEEFQGDWGVEARKHGIRGPELEAEIQAADERWRQAVQREEQLEQEYGMNLQQAEEYAREAQPGSTPRRIRGDLLDAQNERNGAYLARRQLAKRTEKAVPPAPFVPQGWLRLALGRLLNRAVAENKSTLAWPFGEVIAKRYPNKIGDKDWPMKLYDQMVPIELKKLLGKEINIETREIVTHPEESVEVEHIGFTPPSPNSDVWSIQFIPPQGGQDWTRAVQDRQLSQWVGPRMAALLREIRPDFHKLLHSGADRLYHVTPGLHALRPAQYQKVHAVNLAPSVRKRITDKGFSLFTVPLAVGAAGTAAYGLAPRKPSQSAEQVNNPVTLLKVIKDDPQLNF